MHKATVKDDDPDKELLAKQSKRIENEILKVKSQNLGRVGNEGCYKWAQNGCSSPNCHKKS